MSVVTIAIAIVAAFFGGGVYFLSGRAGAGPWLSFTLGLLVALLIFAAGPAAIHP